MTDKYETTFDIDKQTYPDDMKVRICGKDMSLGDARNYYDNFLEHRYKMILFWDDIVQYTSLGLLDLLYQYNDIHEKIIVSEIFDRDFPTYTIDKIYEIGKNHNLSKEYINSFFESHYEEILKCSPLSKGAQSFFKLRDILDSMILIFSYKFDSCEKIVKELTETYPTRQYSSINIMFKNNKTEEEILNNIYNTNKTYVDIVALQEGGALVELIAKHDLHEITIMCPEHHNGIAPAALIYFTEGDDFMGPNNSPLVLLKEEI